MSGRLISNDLVESKKPAGILNYCDVEFFFFGSWNEDGMWAEFEACRALPVGYVVGEPKSSADLLSLPKDIPVYSSPATVAVFLGGGQKTIIDKEITTRNLEIVVMKPEIESKEA